MAKSSSKRLGGRSSISSAIQSSRLACLCLRYGSRTSPSFSSNLCPAFSLVCAISGRVVETSRPSETAKRCLGTNRLAHATKAYAENPLPCEQFLRAIRTVEHQQRRNYSDMGSVGLGSDHHRQSGGGRVCLWHLLSNRATAPSLNDAFLSHANGSGVHR
jgi:hypothetical protein